MSKDEKGRAPEGAATDQKDADDLAQGEPLIPPPDHPAHVPAGDPGREWRRRRRWIDAPGFDSPDGPEALRGLTADEVLDVHFAAVEWLRMAPDPQVRAYAERLREVGEVILRRETNEVGRTRNIGQILGIVPVGPGGLSPGYAIAIRQRNALLRQARKAHPEWRAMTDRQAARAMLAALSRYQSGGWHLDRSRATAPAGDTVRACFCRIFRLEVAVPGSVERMVTILSE